MSKITKVIFPIVVTMCLILTLCPAIQHDEPLCKKKPEPPIVEKPQPPTKITP